MFVYYINLFRDAFWPHGKLAPPTDIRSEEQSQETKQRAQQKLLENIPGEAWVLILRSKYRDKKGMLAHLTLMFFIYVSQETVFTMKKK